MTRTPTRPTRAGTVPWPADLVARYLASGCWAGQPLTASVRAVADRTPGAVAVVDGDVRLTYRELMARADGAALRLRDLGLRPDDRVVVQLPDGWEFVVLTLACLRLGVIPVMTLAAHRSRELRHVAAHAEARAIVVPDTFRGFDHLAMARGVAADTPCVERLLVSGEDPPPDAVDLRALCRPAGDPDRARHQLDEAAPDSRAVALMLLSGGTTGLPKLIARTHDDYGCYVRRTADVLRFGPDTVFLAVLPLGHSLPLGKTLATLSVGGRVVIAASPSPAEVFPLIERERVTATVAVPAIAQRWLAHRAEQPHHDLGSLALMLVGGARLADEVAARMVPTLTRTLLQGYGMAEGLVCMTRPDDPAEVAWHTQGRPICPEDELLLVDDEDRPVPDGEPGALLTRGPCTPRGYYRAPEHNAAAYLGDGWYRTGDIVRLRPDGNLVIEGRVKDMINRGGEKVSAEEIEDLAYRLDGVRSVAAVAMPDPEFGERVCLYLVPQDGFDAGLADVRAAMTAAGLARFKLPDRLVLVDSLPYTNLGKIDKKALRVDIAGRLAAEQEAEARPAASAV